jgi:hypothetical protein
VLRYIPNEIFWNIQKYSPIFMKPPGPLTHVNVHPNFSRHKDFPPKKGKSMENLWRIYEKCMAFSRLFLGIWGGKER